MGTTRITGLTGHQVHELGIVCAAQDPAPVITATTATWPSPECLAESLRLIEAARQQLRASGQAGRNTALASVVRKLRKVGAL